MSAPAKILIVEDEMIIAATISSHLTKMGYEVVGITTRGHEALRSVAADQPDLVLMDIALRGELDGIEVAKRINVQFGIPVIYVTANADDATFQRAKTTRPAGFISKPFREADLRRTIELALMRKEPSLQTDEPAETTVANALDDRLFIRDRDSLVKVPVADILFVEADRTYCQVHTVERTFVVSLPLARLEQELPQSTFMRTHRSFLVNLQRIDAISETRESITLAGKSVPVSRRLRDDVSRRLKLI